MSDDVRRLRDLPPPFDKIDPTQLDRHTRLIELWRDCDLPELLADMGILLQMLHFRAHQDRLVADARVAIAQGAGHDCEEWPGKDGRCLLCGGSVMFGRDR